MFSFTIAPLSPRSLADGGERFLQSPFWAAFKSRHGWKSLFFDVRSEGGAFTVSVLVRRFAKYFSIAYIPMMPSFFYGDTGSDDGTLQNLSTKADETENGGVGDCRADAASYAQFLADFSESLKGFLPKHTLCIRFDPALDFYSISSRDFFVAELKQEAASEKISIVKTKTDIQPPDTTLIDLTKSEDELLSAMRSKWRYNIRLAQKKGVVVRAYRARTDKADVRSLDSDASRALDIFYELYKTTASRDGIAIHAKKYYEDLFALSASHKDAPLITVYIASHEGENLASIITLFSKSEAVYLYGASSNAKRNLMPAYLLQWTAICDAKSYGSAVYDFYGMPPSDDKNHPMYGLYLFKTGFGGRIVHRPGSLDFPLSPLYAPYAFAESARAFYHKRIKKILAGRAL
ncbi:peptidoglycan bridge formation glycyltransferase FemA/FemB family protein [Treponema socranskii]|uniref:lipid II:glycine glycyltransferase FemX n=1 Tax=Treponema socranskii TaxID=53419 RepID=UPI003D904B64